MHSVASHSFSPEGDATARAALPHAPPTAGSSPARAILDRAVVHIPDVTHDPEYELQSCIRARPAGRASLAVPMLRDGRRDRDASACAARCPGRSRDQQIALLQTFADQAVIAIENVRLFTELQARNKDLGEALERQTATADILRAISQAQTDAQPVFEAIAHSALRLFGAWGVGCGGAMASSCDWSPRWGGCRAAATRCSSGGARRGPSMQTACWVEPSSRARCSRSPTWRRTRRCRPPSARAQESAAGAPRSRCRCCGATTSSG